MSEPSPAPAIPASTTRSLEIKVGLLVIVGLLAAVVLILLSDRISFERDYRVAVALADAGGLRPQSPVTLAGIRIGEVESVAAVGNAQGAIRAVVLISERYPLPGNAEVILDKSGLFGEASIAFRLPAGATAQGRLPMDGSASLKAGQGFLDEVGTKAQDLLAAVGDLLDARTRADVKRGIAGAADLAAGAATLAAHLDVQQEKFGDALTAIARLAERLDGVVARLDERLAGTAVRVDGALSAVTDLAARLSESATTASRTLARLDGVIAASAATMPSLLEEGRAALASLRAVSDAAAALVAAIDRGDGVLGQLVHNRDLVRDVHVAAIAAGAIATQLADQPSRLVFDASSSERSAAAQARARELQRRAFQEGFRLTPSATSAGNASAAAR